MPCPTVQDNTIWCIIHKETGKFCSFGSKVAWLKESYAKSAYKCHYKYGIDLKDDNCQYKIIEVINQVKGK